MKVILTICFVMASFMAKSQTNNENAKKLIIEKIESFFSALEKKDTSLYNSIILPGGQIWTVRNQQDSIKNTTRTFSADQLRLVGMNTVIEEKPLRYEIKIHQNIAIAWVPYKLSLSGKFSHCGVDVFTLLNTMTGWKIINASYTIEQDGCAELQKQ